MSCTIPNTLFNGFFIDLNEANIRMAVCNTYGEAIGNAKVSIDLGFKIEVDFTDQEGCVSFSMPSDIDAIITVEKECFQLYRYKFRAINKADYNSDFNFPFTIEGKNGNTVSSPTVTLIYLEGDSPETVVLTENIQGIYEAEFKFGQLHRLEIDAGVEGSFSIDIPTFLKIDCSETAFSVVPVIQLV